MNCKYCGESHCDCENHFSIDQLEKILKFNEFVTIQVAKHGFYQMEDDNGYLMNIEADCFNPDGGIDGFECWYEDDHSMTCLSSTPYGAYSGMKRD